MPLAFTAAEAAGELKVDVTAFQLLDHEQLLTHGAGNLADSRNVLQDGWAYPVRAHYATGMCRNIQQLRGAEPPATDEEIRDAARQFVRKVSGYTRPSAVNERVFEAAVDEVAAATRKLLAGLVVGPTAKPTELRQRLIRG